MLALAPMLPGLQVSVVQDLLSLQFASVFTREHAPVVLLQESTVQDIPSSQAAEQQKPPVHSPALPLEKTHSESVVHAEPGPLE